MPRNNAAIALGLLATAYSGYSFALEPGESVTLDPATGNYVVTYRGEGGAPMRSVFVPQTKTAPFVTSLFDMKQDGAVQYDYSVGSGAASRQAIDRLTLDYVVDLHARRELTRTDENVDKEVGLDRLRACKEAMQKPVGWRTSCTVTLRAPPPGIQLSWLDVEQGIAVGNKLGGFGYSSKALPGMWAARVSGKAFPDWLDRHPRPNDYETYEISDDLDRQLSELSRLTKDGVARWAATAVFEVPDPFDGPQLLEKIRAHVKKWPQQQLMEQALWSTVDGLVGAAVTSLKKGDVAGAGVSLTQVRVELRKKYPDLDVATALDDPRASELPQTPDALKAYLSAHDKRLAAKVLDFDIAFVTMKVDPADQLQVEVPWQGMIYAPPVDTDGSFRVNWSKPIARVQSICGTGLSCKETVTGYVLQMASDATFGDARTAYEGPDQQFQAVQLARGTYFFRVKAHMLRCKGAFGEQGTCYPGDSDAEQIDTGYYTVGPNSTVVSGR